MYRILLPTLLVLFYVPPAAANQPPAVFSAQYDVSRNGIALGGTVRRLIKKSETNYQFISRTEAEGFAALFVSDVITEQSDITYQNNRLRPLKYTYQQTGGSKQKKVDIIFDWQNRRISHSRLPELKQLPDNSHDLLSFQLALSQLLEQQQKGLVITIIDHKRSQEHSLQVVGKESLQTSVGKLETIRLEQKAGKNRYRFSFWCAPQFNYLPVIIKKTEYDGDVITMKLRQFNGKPFQFINNNDSDD